MKPESKIEIENIVSPGSRYRVDAAKYGAMKQAVLAVLPQEKPGLTVAELRSAIVPQLSEEFFPGGAKAGWWMKAVQLDLEAKGVIRRAPNSPVRLHRV
jgi:hypothetical protein